MCAKAELLVNRICFHTQIQPSKKAGLSGVGVLVLVTVNTHRHSNNSVFMF